LASATTGPPTRSWKPVLILVTRMLRTDSEVCVSQPAPASTMMRTFSLRSSQLTVLPVSIAVVYSAIDIDVELHKAGRADERQGPLPATRTVRHLIRRV
jgi:hypothetical protein